MKCWEQVECANIATKITFLDLDGSKVVQPAARGRDDVLMATFPPKGKTTLAHPVETSVSPEGELPAGISKSKEADVSLSTPSIPDGGRQRACPVWP